MELNLICPINSFGYGRTGFEIAKKIVLSGVKLSLFPIGGVEDKLNTSEIQSAVVQSKFFNKNAPCIRIWHQHDMSQFVGKGVHIGFPIFELDTFSTLEKHHLSSCDELFVCSEWARSVCINNGINIPITVVPLGVDIETFRYRPNNSKTTRFLNIGKWERRKGHDILYQSFMSAFPNGDEDVELWMCCDNPFLPEQIRQDWESKYKLPRIRIISRLPEHSDVANLMGMVDCGVFPSRAEGWNLEALEILASGKQLIITDYSAHGEFCNSANSHLISIDSLEIAKDNIWFHGNGNWASLDNKVLDIATAMKKVYDMKQSGQSIINQEGIETANKFTWSNTTSKILSHIGKI